MNKRQTGKLIYIAGPYTYPDPVRNTHRVIKVADDLIDNGFVPYIPHLTLLWHIVSPRQPGFWYDYDYHLLKRCDAVLRIPGASMGADNEVKLAREHGIPVFESMEALNSSKWLKTYSVGDGSQSVKRAGKT